MRHGFAGEKERDPAKERERSLTPEGRSTVLAIAKEMESAGEVPEHIFASPYARTTETADIVGKVFGLRVDIIDHFSPNRPCLHGLEEVVECDELKRVLVVGHEDNLDPMMQELGDDWDDLVMGEVRRVKMDRKSYEWKLRWALKPSDVGRKDHT